MFVKLKTITSLNPLSSIKWVTYSYKNSLKFSLTMTTTIALILFAIILTPSVNGLSSIDEREGRKLFGGYRITPKFCRASKTLPRSDPRSLGPTICMFNHECAQRNGEVVGACMDGFLFGACCQVPGNVDTSLLQNQPEPQIASNLAVAYESYGSQQGTSSEQNVGNNYQGSTGSYYETGGGEIENESFDQVENNYNSNQNSLTNDDNKNNQFYVEQESVLVSSPSTNQFDLNKSKPQNIQNDFGSFSTELPMKIPPAHFASSHETVTHHHHFHTTTTPPPVVPQKIDPNNILTNGEFTHSDITHPGAESVLIEDEDLQFSTGYGPSTVYVPAPGNAQKITHKKPSFKPKPNTGSTKKPSKNDYVLVQTITNGAQKYPSKRPQTEDGMTTNNIESIESIILMLNETNHGPSYNLINSTTESAHVTFSSTYGTQRPPMPTNSYYITTNGPISDSDTHTQTSSIHPTIWSGSGSIISTRLPLTTLQPPLHDSYHQMTTKIPTKRPSVQSTSYYAISSTNRPIIITSGGTKRPTVTSYKKPAKPSRPISLLPPQNIDEIIITPTRKPGTRRPIKNPPSTSYVTGPTPPRLPSTFSYGGSSTLPTISDENKIDVGVSGGGSDGGSSTNNIYSSPQYASSTQKITSVENVEQSESNDGYKPVYVQIPQLGNTQRPHPTVIITPKPTVSNLGTSPWTKRPDLNNKYTTTPNPKQPSTSYIFSPVVTRRPEIPTSTNEYVSLPPISSNDFDDPGYYGMQTVNTNRPFFDQYNQQQQQQLQQLQQQQQQQLHKLQQQQQQQYQQNIYTGMPNDDRPVFPGYYGPTPQYSTFNVPTVGSDKIVDEDEEQETYTSPNDFVNFPPVRNPNLNMSATSSSVTNDFDMSTPTFIQDEKLKDKMSLLVNKIVSSLQVNFEALADLVEDDNNTRNDFPSTLKPSTKRPAQTKLTTTKVTITRRPLTKVTQKPVRNTSAKPVITKRPQQTTKKPIITKKPVNTRRPPPTTKKPTKPIRKVTTTIKTTTTAAPEDEIIDENDEENEIEEDDSAEQSRKIQCGVRPHVKSGRIVGGKGAVFAEWPWQVLVRESTWLGLFTKNKCGGVLITNKFVMTAAHCQPGFLASLVAVFGEFDISGDLETKRSVTKNVKRVIVHRQYDAATFENDLALLELESAIIYDTHIVPICMPSDTADFTGRMATVTGWGRLKYGGGVPSVLQEVQVPIIENSVCQEMFHTAGHNKKILISFLCAGYANGQKDSCEGDSGGPLVLQRSDGRWELAGTVSHGIKCAAPYLPGVYMRTTFYKPWLKTVTGIK